ncbi:methyltransferase domain-containing protein [Pseudodesulfovibrio portus]|uniref:Methyltransferase domain-containing protein n=1 Tax=Pseudodesulfovibrio portus TaxID=231439 RepID=A0ABM8AUG7_9BACT|nr:methyltransferase domain-containing protein [Pseudodesulfovibrio portus]BDQ34947.1 hypothetical protein JCM14722_24890 [Pseudodesulfovibrio portus]
MKDEQTTTRTAEIPNPPRSGKVYEFSPKIIIVAGPPAAGKSYVMDKLADEHGYLRLQLDGINPAIAKQYGGDIEAVRDPKTYADYTKAFARFLRANRYGNIVLEGCRVSHPHIFQAFMQVVNDLYSPFTIVQCFYLNPPRQVRMDRFLLRKIRNAKKNIKGGQGALEAVRKNRFCETLEPILPGFAEVADGEPILQWAEENRNAVHPGVPEADRDVFKAIAEAESFNPFYQTIEYRGRILVPGFTQSPLAWENILKLGVDFAGKTLCDYGCMHGYYTFKAEERGATGVGLDVDQGAVDLANYLASVKGAGCHFMIYDITTPLRQKYDIIMALNVLHRTGRFELTTQIMFEHCNECILEVGESQLPFIIAEGTRQGFKLRRNIPSHRHQSCIGPRRVLHMARKEA